MENLIIKNKNTIESQRIFRLILHSFCHPGRIYDLSFIDSKPYLYPIIKTFLDCEVSFCVLGDKGEDAEKLIEKTTGSRVANISEADFVIIIGGSSKGEIINAKIGEPHYPDLGATLIYYFSSTNTDHCNLKLRGPGIKDEALIKVNGIKRREFELLSQINLNYPLGLDSIFINESGKVFSIPRSTKILEVK